MDASFLPDEKSLAVRTLDCSEFATPCATIQGIESRLQVHQRFMVLLTREPRFLVVLETVFRCRDDVLDERAVRLASHAVWAAVNMRRARASVMIYHFLGYTSRGMPSERAMLPTDREPVAKRGPSFRVPVRVVPVLRLDSHPHDFPPFFFARMLPVDFHRRNIA
jgi:hypothetical protein